MNLYYRARPRNIKSSVSRNNIAFNYPGSATREFTTKHIKHGSCGCRSREWLRQDCRQSNKK